MTNHKNLSVTVEAGWLSSCKGLVSGPNPLRRPTFSEVDMAFVQVFDLLDEATDLAQLYLDFYNLDTNTFVQKYGAGISTRTLGDKSRELLEHIRAYRLGATGFHNDK